MLVLAFDLSRVAPDVSGRAEFASLYFSLKTTSTETSKGDSLIPCLSAACDTWLSWNSSCRTGCGWPWREEAEDQAEITAAVWAAHGAAP